MVLIKKILKCYLLVGAIIWDLKVGNLTGTIIKINDMEARKWTKVIDWFMLYKVKNLWWNSIVKNGDNLKLLIKIHTGQVRELINNDSN